MLRGGFYHSTYIIRLATRHNATATWQKADIASSPCQTNPSKRGRAHNLRQLRELTHENDNKNIRVPVESRKSMLLVRGTIETTSRLIDKLSWLKARVLLRDAIVERESKFVLPPLSLSLSLFFFFFNGILSHFPSTYVRNMLLCSSAVSSAQLYSIV